MAAFDYWINRLFQGGEQTRGLSGAEASSVALDDSNSFYNFRLRRHYSDDDMIRIPLRLWFTSDDSVARTGLGPHVSDAMSEGQRFSDVMIVLSQDDWNRGVETGEDWVAKIQEEIRSAYADLRARSGLAPSSRPLGVWVVAEGSEELGGTDFGLVGGEFITGIVPNLYREPGSGSRPLLALHANLPGVWTGYREVGRLYDDQILLTLGNHWLDNIQHPSLDEAAIYRLQRHGDGSFFHIINPDLQDRYQMTSTDQDGTSVITLATRDGRPLAYLILAVLDDAPPAPEYEDYVGDEPPPLIAPPMMLDEEPVNVDAARPRGSKTIIPDAQRERIFTLQERGALLQKVHFSAFMLGYDVFVGQRGELGTAVVDPAATFQVRKRTVSVLANVDGIVVDGEPLPSGESRLIETNATIEVGGQQLEYVDLRTVKVDGWPYVGEIRRPASSTYMLWGRDYTVGRSRECRVVLPDEPQNDNIVWKPKVGDGATIRSKTGEIPKARFYTDSIMVASEHSAIELLDDQPQLACRARHCYAFIRRQGEVMSLYPSTLGKLPVRMSLEPGDEVLVGNCLFHASFTPVGHAVAPTPGPAPILSSDSLVDLVPEPVLGDLDAADTGLDVDSLIDMDDAAIEPLEPDEEEEPMSASFDNLPSELDELEPPPIPKFDEDAEEDINEFPDTFQVFTDRPPQSMEPEDAPTVQTTAIRLPDEEPPEPVVPDVVQPDDVPTVQESAEPSVHLTLDNTPGTESGVFFGLEADQLAGEVAVVDDQAAMFELGRPARFVMSGWTVSGSVVCGNFEGCDLVLPESRVSPEQSFEPRSYFQLKVRGRKGRLDPVDVTELRIDGDLPLVEGYDKVEELAIEVIRRDDSGEEDFVVPMTIVADRKLPDPRAKLVKIDLEEPLVEALFSVGVALRSAHRVTLNGISATAEFDGKAVTLTDYLQSYKIPGGFRPFFVQQDGKRFRTAPEDGSPIVLNSGDRVVLGAAVYEFLVA